jgi:hypothetical protein
MRLIFLLSLSLFCSGWGSRAFAQNIPHFRITITSEMVGLPFSGFSTDNLGIELGVSLKSIERPASARHIFLNVGTYFHREFSNTYYLLPSYIHSVEITEHFSWQFEGGMGAHWLRTNFDSFRFEDGSYQSIGKHQTLGALARIGTGFTYHLSEKTAPFLQYNALIEYPFAPAGGIPVLPRSLLQLGLQHQF